MFDGRWRHAVDRTTKPVGRALVRAHITADVLTVFGLVMSVVLAIAVGSGHLVAGIILLFPTGLPDLFDGPVAKASGTASVRGAFFDSVADRISDGFLFGGVAWYLVSHHHGTVVLVPFAIVAITSLISYERAKAELLGLSARGGLMERAERFILLGLCFIAAVISPQAFVPALWVFLSLITATAVSRFVKVWKEAEGPPSWRPGRVDSRWSAWRAARSAQLNGTAGRDVRRRRVEEPLGRWRARRQGVPSSRSGRVVRARKAARPQRERARAGSRHSSGI